MKIAYQAFDQAGKAVAATLEAPSIAEATETLRRQGLFVTQAIQAAQSAATGTGKMPRAGSGGQRLGMLAVFSRQLFVLVNSGTPMVQALTAIERQTESPRWRAVVADLRERVEEGAGLSAAMESHPAHFDSVCRSLVAAGESSGNMTAMLERMSSMARNQLRLRNSIFGAMIYPTVLVFVGLGVFATMLLLVVPRFEGLFQTLDVPLPPTTQFLISLSNALRGYWWAGLLALGAAGFGCKLYWATAAGRRAFDQVVFKIPKVGKLVRNLLSARAARMLGTLLESKVPLLEALQLTRDAAGNMRFAEVLANAEAAVTRGEPMSDAFADTLLVNTSVFEAIRHGEQSGQVGSLLLHIAEFLDEENEVVLKALTKLVEPLILIVLGVLVGFIALSMFLPLFDLAAMAQGRPQ
jgi:type II secretory pathway component PulF